LTRRSAEAGEGADSVVRTARARADAVLELARRREDEKVSVRASEIGAARAREDATIAEERRLADDVLAAERVQRQIVLAGLLAVSRLETDSRLVIERSLADKAMARRDDFLAMLSHDMRSLLGGIALNAALLERKAQAHDPARITQCAASILRSTTQMNRLVADLLDVATIDAGKLVLLKGPCDALGLVRDAGAVFELIASEKGISVSLDAPNETLSVDVDPDRIGQVLGNLLGNAAKFTHAGGKITIGVARRGREARFFVADSGEGIPAEKLETIFDRYAQMGQTDRRGLGLGLYIARRIVEAHGGRLWAESTLGKGSTFFFSLPAPT
jgi:signal transduction histidine kinase